MLERLMEGFEAGVAPHLFGFTLSILGYLVRPCTSMAGPDVRPLTKDFEYVKLRLPYLRACRDAVPRLDLEFVALDDGQVSDALLQRLDDEMILLDIAVSRQVLDP